MTRAGKIAALGADGLWIEGEGRRVGLAGGATPARVLFDFMAHHGVDSLHLHRSALAPLELPDALDPPLPGERRPAHAFCEGAGPDGVPLSTRALSPSIVCGGREITIGAYQDGWGDSFEEAESAGELLGAHLAFTSALGGWRFRNSAAVSGWNLMHWPWRVGERKKRLARAHFEENERPTFAGADEQCEIPFGAWAPPREQAPAGRYASAWDINGQRLSACARLSVGVGGLEHRSGAAFDPKLPGYHLLDSPPAPADGPLPPIFEAGWHTTPRVAMASYLGLEPEIRESWVWTEHVPYLNPFYERLRDARSSLLGRRGAAALGAPIALGALKQCYLQPLGRLRSRRARERGDVLYRPDWYDAVIGCELAREYLHLHRLAAAGVGILAVYFDAVVISTAEPGLAPAELPVSQRLGHYKPAGSLPMGRAQELLYGEDLDRPNVAALMRALKDA